MARYDWEAIGRFYAEGHSMREAQAKFGFSNGAWARAVERGDVAPRPGRPRGPNGATRAKVAELLSAGLSKAEVARRLGISKSSVSRHAARSGFEIDERGARRHDWAAIQAYYDEGHSIRECMLRFGIATSTFNEARLRGDIVARPARSPLSEIFASGTRRARSHLKQRLKDAGLLPDACELCGIADWRGRALSLQLHHINGDPLDNRLENLILLCPNCHSQTENWGGRNRRSTTDASSVPSSA